MSYTQLADALLSHALTLGQFEQVNGHEPKSAPGNGLTAALWLDRIEPVRTSGLDSTSARVALMLRVYQPMLSEPQDAIDPAVYAALDELIAAYSGDFTLGGLVRAVDLLGSAGVPLSAQAGYITQDSRLYRVVTLTVPLIVNDAWEQGE